MTGQDFGNGTGDDPELSPTWREFVGDELLGFMLNLEPGALELADPARLRALEWLTGWGEEIVASDPRSPVALVTVEVDYGKSLAWEMHESCGGTRPQPFGENPAEWALTTVARDLFPLLLAPAHTLVAGPGLEVPAGALEVALDQLAERSRLRKNFESAIAEEGFGQVEGVFEAAMSVAGLGESLTLVSLIQHAVRRARHMPPTPASFMEAAVTVLAELRRVAQGEQIQVPAYLGLSAFSIDAELELPQGRLRPPYPAERRYLPFGRLAEAVLEVTVPAGLRQAQGSSRVQSEGFDVLEAAARELILAAALAHPDPVPRSCPAVAWSTVAAPAGGAGAHRPLNPGEPPGRDGSPDAAELARLETWASRIEAAELQHVDIGVQRLLQALWEPQWTESLIDAVICWENLLGTSHETSFRVTAAMAVVCEPDPPERMALRKKLSDAYRARNSLVHGGRPPSDLHQRHEVAVRYALETLRQLIAERPDLLELESSEARADRLLLGVPPDDQARANPADR